MVPDPYSNTFILLEQDMSDHANMIVLSCMPMVQPFVGQLFLGDKYGVISQV